MSETATDTTRLGSSTLALTVATYGVRLRLSASDAELLDAAKAALPPQWAQVDGHAHDRSYDMERSLDGSSCALWIDGGFSSRHDDVRRLADACGADAQIYVAEMAPDRVFVHAGVVGWRGRAILVPGRTWSGKTTLVAALAAAGATYYSDEYAVLDLQGVVYPYPQPLGVRAAGGRTRLDPRTLPAGVGASPLPVGAVMLTEYRPEASWTPKPLSPGQAVLALLAHTVSVRRQPERALTALRRALAGASVLRGSRGEAAEVASAMLDGCAWRA